MGLALCVVGCGGFAKTFAKAVRSFQDLGGPDGVELFFASRDQHKAKAYCEAFGGRDSFASYEAAAADSRVEAMYFSTPHHLHAEHALMAAAGSKHILVEKPIARTVDEAERMIAAARAAGVKLMVAENYRFMPVVQRSRELITEGAIGAVRFIQIQEEMNFVVRGWRSSQEMMGGGVLIDGGIHSVDMLIDLAGMPEEVYACSLPRALGNVEGEDGIVLMDHPGGWSRRPDRALLGDLQDGVEVQRVAISGSRWSEDTSSREAPRVSLETKEGRSTISGSHWTGVG